MLVPGRLAKVKGKLVRCKKRTNGCEGCILASIILCPNVVKNGKRYDCIEDGVIFVKPY